MSEPPATSPARAMAWQSGPERTLDLEQPVRRREPRRLETPPFSPGAEATDPPKPAPGTASIRTGRPETARSTTPAGAPAPEPVLEVPTEPGPKLTARDESRTASDATAAIPGEGRAESADARARRLARVLVSDILVYNQEMRDRALQEGNLISALGSEINKAWELYKSKVEPQVVGTTAYFKDALNEILAGGKKVF